jgi:hypothetical protein
MSKVIGMCEFCVPCVELVMLLPTNMKEFVMDNNIEVITETEADFSDMTDNPDFKLIVVSDYPCVSMSKEIVVDYLIEYNHISDESELEDFLESIYVDTDFDHLAEFVEDNYPKVNFADCITNKDELLKEVRLSLKNDYNFQE